MNLYSMSGWLGLGEWGVNYGGPTLYPAFGQLIQGGGVFRKYLKLIPDSRVVAGYLTN